MTREPGELPNNIVNAPKSVHLMKAIIQPVMLEDRELVAQMHGLVGFQIEWKSLTVTQAAMVWLAWNAVHGDEGARVALNAMKGIQIEEQEQISPQEIAALRQVLAEYRKADRTASLGWRSPMKYPTTLEAAVATLILERNEAIQALTEAHQDCPAEPVVE